MDLKNGSLEKMFSSVSSTPDTCISHLDPSLPVQQLVPSDTNRAIIWSRRETRFARVANCIAMFLWNPEKKATLGLRRPKPAIITNLRRNSFWSN